MARKILLADDSVTAQNMGRKILADAGYEVITVNNGSAALKKIAELRPDVIVLDVYMPGYSGLEVCQRIKEAGDTSRIPILLTVGKLEPFKPEEARRVRADAFIVKPFEASELLSALTKLEDKIVPRNESSKPGRFARAASSDDSRYDKTMAVEEDAGWKNRIAFPTKKKEKEKEIEVEEPVAQSPAIKDVRAVIEQMPVIAPDKAEERVDLGALAPVGLPKDVTPEEIAALAAAAARVKGKIAGEKREESASELPVVAPPPVDAPSQESPAAIVAAEVAPAPEAGTSVPAAVTADAEIEDGEAKVTADSNEVSAAIANLEQSAAVPENSGNGSWPHETSEAASEPVTMAVAATTESGSPASRWTAVPVALAPEDAAISLDQEMQKAYAAFAAAESGHSASAPITASTDSETSTTEAVGTEASISVPATVAPDVAQTLSAVASAATDAVSAAVKELENVASAYAAQAPTPVETSPSSEISASSGHEVKAATEVANVEPPASEESKEALASEKVEAPSVASEISSATSEVGSHEPTAEHSPDANHKESESSATTAAAWASWKPGESDDAHVPSQPEASAPRDAAAMAAAVGGKSAVEDAAAESDADTAIASIVDSVLANLRPKIVEEISRKLGKK